MSPWEMFVAVLTVLASAVTLVLLYNTVRRNPVREAEDLAKAFLAVEQVVPEFRPIARSRVLEAAAIRHFASPARTMFLWAWIYVVALLLATAVAPASSERKIAGFIFGLVVYILLLWGMTKTDAYRQQRRLQFLLLAEARAELKQYVNDHQEVDTRSLDDRKFEDFLNRVSVWVRTTRGAKEVLLLTWLAGLILALWLMALDLGWL